MGREVRRGRELVPLLFFGKKKKIIFFFYISALIGRRQGMLKPDCKTGQKAGRDH